uniref:HIG1 domain-containing protein n=1 Tax=Meloidogyne floridensis TaxID=298350 RepID=A0A915P5F1_9BILA
MSTTENSTESDRKQFMTWKQLTPKKPSTSASHNSQNNESTVKHKKSAVPMMPADLLQVQKFVDKISINPFIPLGIAATSGFLVSMLFASYRKDLKRLQFYMRGRIAAQGFTFAAFGVGVWYISKCDKEDYEEQIKE